MEIRFAPDAARYPRLTTPELRAGYLIENLFQPGSIQLLYTDVDRAVVGGIVAVVVDALRRGDTSLLVHLGNGR